MAEYVPTEDELRAIYVTGTPPHRVSVDQGNAEFNRRMAIIRAEARAEGYDDAYAEGVLVSPLTPPPTEQEREAAVERVAEVVREHTPYLDETAVYVGGCNGCDWQEPKGFRYWVDNSTHPEHVARAALAAYKGSEVGK